MRHTYWYAAVTKDAAQHRSWTFYEVVNFQSWHILKELSRDEKDA